MPDLAAHLVICPQCPSIAATEFPAKLFETLDKDWQEYASIVQNGSIGLIIPPVLAIVLERAASRQAIPRIVSDLRDEWDTPRHRVWDLISNLKTATLQEALELKRELTDASRYFSPATKAYSTSPLQFLWSLFVSAAKGAATAGISGGNIGIGAITQATGQVLQTVQGESNFARVLFGRGAFGLARKVRREVSALQASPSLLAGFLSDAEKTALGI